MKNGSKQPPSRHERIARAVNKELGLPKAGNAVTAELVRDIERGDSTTNHPVHVLILTKLKHARK